jgi:hypothetical protein
LAEKGEAAPFVTSSYRIYGTYPDLVWGKIMSNRRARLGKEMNEWYDAAGNIRPDLPKKKPTSYIDEQSRTSHEASSRGIAHVPRERYAACECEADRQRTKAGEEKWDYVRDAP